MICPYCGANEDRVIDSRSSEGGQVVRRRRQCEKCGRRFTTYERVEEAPRLTVIKRDGKREPFDREKIARSVAVACGKRPIPAAEKEALLDAIEEEVHREFDREAPSREIGERVMRRLRDLDDVAYVRFASEHHNFRNADELGRELEELRKFQRDVKDQQKLFAEGE
ncbi:MAG: transcriptional regulator NrdR [Phycisphaerales bacterium]